MRASSDSPPTSTDQRPRERPPFQFSLGRLFALTAACAGGLSLASTIKASLLIRLLVAFCVVFLVAYIVLRVPHIYRIWKHVDRRREEGRALLTQTMAAAKEAEKTSAHQQPKASATQDQPD